jgi:Helix-turn-helix domain
MAANEWDHGLMDVAETARMLNVPISWVYGRTRRRGKDRIPHIKLGKYLRFETESVRKWLNGQRTA